MKFIIHIKQFILRYKLRKKARIHSSAFIKNVEFEGHNTIMRGVKVRNAIIGEGTYVNENSNLYSVRIGRYSCIADNVSIVTGEHPISDFITMYPSFYYDTTNQLGFTFHKGKALFNTEQYVDADKGISVVIGNDVWVGSHVIILGGVSIGDGAVIAAGSVVTKDVEPYSIVGGIPAKHIRFRFPDNEKRIIQSSKWWLRSFDDLTANYQELLNMNTFLTKHK